ncbi:TetR/AcrR family transcriptional regulator [Rhodococcus sp. BP-252]|uniref:TetR/AcrR family transcriptional regulator n=1 Tax=unclassified Rhodococcus (in: high G+C Gram-positive bacteria) TaxID=192944 RepID=UPI001C9BA74E|nr:MULTISPECIES: TetR/AcrR family transcriptional regulator [unclassified Rhodococcus (in: high G+C Gram-positive bacteria)]MBY6414668.1 TetR/AcrR family transcriptional regulator [Rhodococcus sp. BP-320]MBY6419493.1 TetR/AcrR family transcriptional regulator [Rhodococcus sp. BP-321]MBY6424495.1 TetR/AcrR family transcriptional regulator [Rhodococcus sp. BP-324]MBY6429504.1 TetR/AcrR family transcriptional regulator [Rhodococcus sp. BP-323]MBY6434505.1 TetR/AcrR family transcriptional regulato
MPPDRAEKRRAQQERARVTRVALVDAAALEFARRGYAAASVNTILASGGRTKGAMYFHFQSKDAIGQAVTVEASRRYTELAEPWRTDAVHPIDALTGLLDDITTAAMGEPVLLAELRLGVDPDFPSDPAARASRGWENVAVELADSAASDGCFAAPFDPVRFVHAIASMVAGGCLFAHLSDDPIALRARLDECVDTVVAAMMTPDAAARYRTQSASTAISRT